MRKWKCSAARDSSVRTFRAVGAGAVQLYIPPAMRPLLPPPPLPPRSALLAIAACRPTAPAAPRRPRRPEFVLSAGDSSFWVTSAAGRIRRARRPAGARHASTGASTSSTSPTTITPTRTPCFVGQRVYRRDLVTGDSVLVFQDTLVPRLARRYGRLHPDDQPLRPNDEPSEEPRWPRTSTLDAGARSQGPFVSYSLHTDVERDDAPLWHTSRRGVLDLRTRPARHARRRVRREARRTCEQRRARRAAPRRRSTPCAQPR